MSIVTRILAVNRRLPASSGLALRISLESPDGGITHDRVLIPGQPPHSVAPDELGTRFPGWRVARHTVLQNGEEPAPNSLLGLALNQRGAS